MNIAAVSGPWDLDGESNHKVSQNLLLVRSHVNKSYPIPAHFYV